MSDAPKKTRSPVERIIVWGLILIMLLVVGIEYRAKSNYDKALNVFSDMGAPTFAELKANVSGATVGEPRKNEFKDTEVDFKFFSIFKDYRMVAQLAEGEDGTAIDDLKVANFYTPVALEDEQDRAKIIPPAAVPEGGVALPSAPAGAGMGGGGGGGGRRKGRPETESDGESGDGDATEATESSEAADGDAGSTEPADGEAADGDASDGEASEEGSEEGDN